MRARDLTGSGPVLVVDDEDTVRRTVKTTLHRYGYCVVTAANGRDVLELFQGVCDKVVVVVLDMTMPVMSGEEALDRMQAVCPSVKVILSSGFSEAEALRRFRGKGLAGFIQKPYSAVQLAQKIKDALEEGRYERFSGAWHLSRFGHSLASSALFAAPRPFCHSL